MAGSHRAPTPPRRSGRLVRTLGIVAVVAVIIAGAYAFDQSRKDDPDPAGSGSPTTTPTPSSLPTVTLSPTPTPTPKPTATAKPLPRVKPSAPKRLVVSGLLDVGFDSTITPKNGVLQPGSTAEVARWGGRGVPGSPSRDTVFLIGKVSANGAFQKLPRLHSGSHVTLRTQTGLLTYTVRTVTRRKAAGLTHDPTFARRVPNRLQLVGIRYDSHGDRTGTVVVVTAELTRARAGR